MDSLKSQHPAETNIAIEQLKREHSTLQKRINQLSRHLALSHDEELEKKELQKRKLAKKDLIAALEAKAKA